ncbi:MAG: dienelactone hydrolase family protein [Thermoanaerobaculia bacterium]
MLRIRLTAACLILTAAPLLLPCPADAGDDYVARMAHEHAGESPTPTAAVIPEPAQPVFFGEVEYAKLDGKPVRGYLARPVAVEGPLPAILVIQEWWGLNDNIRAVTRRLAGEGYVALAVDLYEGRTASDADSAMKAMQEALAQAPRLTENLRQAHAYLEKQTKATKVGVIGWCFGGGWSLATALDLGDGIDAAVMYYGRVVTAPAELAKLKAPLLGLFGGKDEGIPVAGVREMENQLKKLGKQATIVVYPEADHAFANPSGQRYDAAAANDCWSKTTAFFAEHLKK